MLLRKSKEKIIFKYYITIYIYIMILYNTTLYDTIFYYMSNYNIFTKHSS